MSLSIQIKTILFSIFFGMVFSFLLNINYRMLVKNRFINVFVTFLFVMVFVLIYFFLLRRINSGIFHHYEIFCIVIGFLLDTLFHSFIEKIMKK